MDFTRRRFIATIPAAAAGAISGARGHATPPAPYGPLPSLAQLAWSEMEFYNFVHFSINTFTGKEWGYGDEDPALFNPADFDADAIVETLKLAGTTGVILTAKHHAGFCLWPTKTTDYSIRRSPYRGGKGDIVKELAEAAARHGIKFGIYVSPWDRHEASYGTPAYVELYRRQLREVLTHYGPVFEIWHDGANGGDGYYGGAREKRVIDKHTYYDWPGTWKMEHELQPESIRFSDAGPDIRWIGNEKGVAGEPCWETFTPQAHDGGPGVPGDVREGEAETGIRNGKFWMPAECDVSIRPGWFWHADENSRVKTGRQLLQLYYESVGRGAAFLLNVPPDRRGRIERADADALREFGRLRRSIFSADLARGAKAKADNVRGGATEYDPKNLIDGSRESYWSSDDGVRSPQAELAFERAVRFNLVRLRENIRLGQRVGGFAVEIWRNGDWSTFGKGASIGACRILRSDAPISTTRIRLRITEASACPALSELALFADL